ARQRVMDGLKRQPFPAQAQVVQAIAALLLDQNEQAGIINAEMRPGKPDGGSRRNTILKSMCRIPTIGPVRAERLLSDFGEDFL
ncbi:hypothetical protein DND58_31220, partial [Pseudomonas syringae pv. pisi]